MGLSFNQLRLANIARCEKEFHPLDAWRPSQWSNAMAGESGEVCNLTKKMDRILDSIYKNTKPEDRTIELLTAQLADEIADVVIYADLLAARVGLNLGDIILTKFNAKSDEIGSAIKLP